MEDFKETFNNHKVKIVSSDIENHLIVALFRQVNPNKPKQFISDGYMKLIITGGTLIVTGDYGDAIYQWNERITWKWFADMDIHYFSGKCQASEKGRRYVDWDSEKVFQRMKDILYEYVGYKHDNAVDEIEECNFELEDAMDAKIESGVWLTLTEEERNLKVKAFLEDLHLSYPEITDWCNSYEQLSSELYHFDEADEIFGDLEWMSIGWVPAYRCILHLAACKEIYEKIEKIRNDFTRPNERLTKVRQITFPGKAICKAIVDQITEHYMLQNIMPDVIESDLIDVLSSSEYEHMFRYVIEVMALELRYHDV